MRRILLLLCVVFVALAYAVPCFVLPFGSYEQTSEVAGVSVKTTLSLTINGEAKYKIGDTEEVKCFYKIKDGEVNLYLEKDSEEVFQTLTINSFNKLNGMKNKIGDYITIAFGVIAVVGILLPYKKR